MLALVLVLISRKIAFNVAHRHGSVCCYCIVKKIYGKMVKAKVKEEKEAIRRIYFRPLDGNEGLSRDSFFTLYTQILRVYILQDGF